MGCVSCAGLGDCVWADIVDYWDCVGLGFGQGTSDADISHQCTVNGDVLGLPALGWI